MDKETIAFELMKIARRCEIYAQKAMEGDGQAMWEAPMTNLAAELTNLSDAVTAL